MLACDLRSAGVYGEKRSFLFEGAGDLGRPRETSEDLSGDQREEELRGLPALCPRAVRVVQVLEAYGASSCHAPMSLLTVLPCCAAQQTVELLTLVFYDNERFPAGA